MVLGDIIAGILKGIGALIGELRKSREVIRFLRYIGSVLATFIITASAGYGLGLDKPETLKLAALAAASVAVASPLASKLDIRLPQFIASAIFKRISLVGWQLENGPPPVPSQAGGAYLLTGTLISTAVTLDKPMRLVSLNLLHELSEGARLNLDVTFRASPKKATTFSFSLASNTSPSKPTEPALSTFTLQRDVAAGEQVVISLGCPKGSARVISIQTDPPILPMAAGTFSAPNAPSYVLGPPDDLA